MSKKELQPFQLVGRDFFASHPHAANGDDPGLGKTVQALAAASKLNVSKALVTCPASVRTSWLQHIEEMIGSTRGWDVVSYNFAAGNGQLPGALQARYDLWIGDESHFCKNPESKRTQAIYGRGGLARRALRKWCLSGTLAPNGRPVELWPMLKTLCPAFKDMSYTEYTQRYCGAFFDGRGMNVKGATRIDELHGLMDGFLIRRTKAEVFPDRRAPIVSLVPVDLTERELSAVRAEEDKIGGRVARISSRYEDFSQLGDASRLLRMLGESMAPRAASFVLDLLESRDKVVVFVTHISVMAALMDKFASAGVDFSMYRGGMSDDEKDEAIDRFSRPGCRVFIGQRQAAGTGINGLQKVCSTAVIAEPGWAPGDTEQLIDRLDRIGQDDEIVNAYVMYARATLSAVVVQVHDRKDLVAERLMDGNVDVLEGL